MQNSTTNHAVIVHGVLDIAKDLLRDSRIENKVYVRINIPESNFEAYIEVVFLKPHYIDPLIWIIAEFIPSSDPQNIALMTVHTMYRSSKSSLEGFDVRQIEDAKPHFEEILVLLDQYEENTEVKE